MSGFIRQIRLDDGTPITPPTSVASAVASWEVFANDAGYEAVYGAGTQGDAYFNSTELVLRVHNGTEWVYLQNGINSLEDSATTGANQDLDPTYHNLLKVSNATLTSVRSIDPGQTLVCYLANDTGGDITLQHDDAGATAANRLLLPDGVAFTLGDGNVAHFVYDNIATRWRYTNTPGEGGGSTGGAAGKNYVLNPSALSDLTGITSSATTGSWTLTRTTILAELAEPSVGTGLKVSGTGLTVGDYIEFESLTNGIDDADNGRIGLARSYFKDIAGTLIGKIGIQVWDNDNSVYIEQQADDVTGTGLFQASAALRGEADLRVRLVALDPTVTEFSVPTVTLEPGVPQQGALILGWESYTPTNSQGFGTITSELQWRTLGQSVQIMGSFDAGTVSGVEAQLGLPNNYTIDFSAATTGTQKVGTGNRSNVSIDTSTIILGTHGDTYLNFGSRNSAGSGNALSILNGNSVLASSERLTFFAEVPVLELSQAQTPLASDILLDTAGFSATSNDGHTPTGSPDIVIYEDVQYNIGDVYDSSTGIFTAPVTGKYDVSASASRLSGSKQLVVYINGTSTQEFAGADVANGLGPSSIAGTVELQANDTLRVGLSGTGATNSSSSFNKFAVNKRPSFSSRATGLPVDTLANADLQYLISQVRTATITLDNEFTGGTLTCQVTRMFDKVTITGEGIATHASATNRSSSSGLIPTWARPIDDTFGTYYAIFGLEACIAARTTGVLQTFYTSGGAASSQVNSVAPINITYNV